MAGHRWQPGQSGNPAGRPKGIRDRRSRLTHAIEADLPQLLRTIMDAALAGDMQAAGLILSRLYPPLKAREMPVRFSFDPAGSVADQCEAVIGAMAAGVIPPDVGRTLLDSLSALASAREIETLEQRIAALEQHHER